MVWCVQQLGRPWDESAFNLAVGWRTAGLVEWMADNGCPMPVGARSVRQEEGGPVWFEQAGGSEHPARDGHGVG